MQRRISDVEFQTIIGDETEVNGNIKGKKNIRIKGIFNGDIASKGVVWVDFSGYVDGNVDGKFVIVSGKITGDVKAKKRLEIGRTADIGGIVSSKEVYIESQHVAEDIEGKKKTHRFEEKRDYFLDNIKEE